MSALAVNPKEDVIALSLSNGQMFLLTMKNKNSQSPQQAPSAPALSFLHTSFHIGPITGESALGSSLS